MTIDLKHFEKKLLAEKKKLEKELQKVGVKNPEVAADWLPQASDRDVSQADENTVADSIEDFEENAAILSTLEARYNDVLSGLDKIKHKSYGVCQVCGREIEADRLEANPAARTCKEHM